MQTSDKNLVVKILPCAKWSGYFLCKDHNLKSY